LSGPQLAECGDGTLLVEIDHIHDQVVRVNDLDRQVQVGRREVRHVKRDNRGPCVAMAVTTTWPIRGTHGFKSVGLGHLGIDLSVWKYRVHGGNAVHAFPHLSTWAHSSGEIAGPFRVCAVTTSD
jgi:hypothetical protein